jgi:outer membrane protein OmpA-like peptidoglycan-associated protein
MKLQKGLPVGIGLAMLIALSTAGCATKKFVHQRIEPVDRRIEEVDKKASQTNQALAKLDEETQRGISRADERALTADGKAVDAARAAQQADAKAGQANQLAQNAQQLAVANQSKLGDVERMVENLDKYKLVTTEDILFGFNKSQLTGEAKAKLDQLAQSASGTNRAILEIEGFTDQTGAREYNLTLSRRRADAVTRYLVSHNVPLRSVHALGLGSEQPVGEKSGASRAEMRKQMRRVVVRVYAPEIGLAATAARMETTPRQ